MPRHQIGLRHCRQQSVPSFGFTTLHERDSQIIREMKSKVNIASALARFFGIPSPLAAAFLFVIFIQPSYADQGDETFLVYAVNIDMHSWRGNGIYLGKGLFLTAAHVIGRSWLTRPEIVIAGQRYPTRVIKEGSSSGTDLTLLAVEESLL